MVHLKTVAVFNQKNMKPYKLLIVVLDQNSNTEIINSCILQHNGFPQKLHDLSMTNIPFSMTIITTSERNGNILRATRFEKPKVQTEMGTFWGQLFSN